MRERGNCLPLARARYRRATPTDGPCRELPALFCAIQHTGRINDHEVTHAPGPVHVCDQSKFRRACAPDAAALDGLRSAQAILGVHGRGRAAARGTVCQCSKSKHVVVPCARTRPSLSVNVPSAVPIRRPQLITLPSAFTSPVSGVTGRTSEILNSSVVCAKPLSSMERMASPMQLSSRAAARPPCTVPAGLRCPAWGFCGGNDAALGNLHDVLAERLRHTVQR